MSSLIWLPIRIHNVINVTRIQLVVISYFSFCHLIIYIEQMLPNNITVLNSLSFVIMSESRMLGYDVRLRPKHDNFSDLVLIPDPSQTLLADDVIIGWRVFVKIASSSIEHEVFLQVWRPVFDTWPDSSGAN